VLHHFRLPIFDWCYLSWLSAPSRYLRDFHFLVTNWLMLASSFDICFSPFFMNECIVVLTPIISNRCREYLKPLKSTTVRPKIKLSLFALYRPTRKYPADSKDFIGKKSIVVFLLVTTVHRITLIVYQPRQLRKSCKKRGNQCYF